MRFSHKKPYSASLKAVLIIIAAVLLIPYVPQSTKAVETTSAMQEIMDRQAELQSQAEELNATLEELQSSEADAQAYSDALQAKIELTQTKIDTAIEDIATLNDEISVLEDNIAKADEEYADTFELLKTRIRAIYESGDVGTIEILLNSTSLYDFSMKTEMLSAVTSHDKELCDEIQEYIDKTKDDKDALKSEKAEVAELKKQLESDKDELEDLIEENEAVIASIQSDEADTLSEIGQIEEEDAELEAQLLELIEEQRQKEAEEEAARIAAEEERRRQEEENRNNNDDSETDDSDNTDDGDDSYFEDNDDNYVEPTPEYTSGLYCIWPLPGYGTGDITQYYGNNGHMGMDIGVPYGTPIVAAASGKVISADYHWSWGNNVLIYHNSTYCTRYAHMSSIAAWSGQWVEQGQVIGYVGSTGNSTGNHLHFEVYENDYRVNPWPFMFG
ncbi:MAG: peptidoglycan DD-metalloendopeptidase family protein [Clostridia bacterium]|nr:peptidoglycan DD-metalloendopeptidase family protein [Clostridia bacterium]